MQTDPAAPDADAPLFHAFWCVVAEHGWRGTTFHRIAEASGQSLDALRARFSAPRGVLAAFDRHVDRVVLAGAVPNQGGTVRDRLFDALMRRFDALQPFRTGVLRFRDDLLRDPLLALSLWPALLASMAWLLEGAEVEVAGARGAARVHGLAGVWLDASRAWAADESVDLGATMSALDRALDRGERVARTLGLDDGDLAPTPPAASAGFIDAPPV